MSPDDKGFPLSATMVIPAFFHTFTLVVKRNSIVPLSTILILKPMKNLLNTKIWQIKVHSVMTILVLMAMIFLLGNSCKKNSTEDPPPGSTENQYRFVFLADSRGDSMGYMTDTTALNPIIRQIGTLNPKPAFVMFGGDMCYRGYMDKEYTFQKFEDLFADLTAKGIPLYTVIGNHELYHTHSRYGFLLTNQEHYQTVFSENPSNGPAGYQHLTYCFTNLASSSFFAVLDSYYVDADTVHPKGLGGHIDSVQMKWLKNQVAGTTAKHKFLFIHCPYYYVNEDPDEPSIADTSFTELWSFLDVNKFDMLACGHSHLYARRTVDASVIPFPQTTPQTPLWQNNVVQLLCGTCGAGPDVGTIDPAIRTAWNVHNDHETYYFSVVDIVGSTVTVNSYKGHLGTYSIFETFTITR
jgi:hypothetical protein